MPLSEFHPAARSKFDSNQSSMNLDHFSSSLPDSELMELLWENGQIVVQGQSSRPRKNSIPASSSQPTKLQEKEGGDCVLPKINRVGVMDSVANDFSPAGISSQRGSDTQADENDMVPWLSCPVDDYCCLELLSELSGSNTTTLPVHVNSMHVDKGSGSCSQVLRDPHSSEQNVSPKASNGGSLDSGRTRNIQFNQMPQQWPGSVSPSKNRTSDIAAGITSGLPDAKLQRQDPISPNPPSPPPAPTGGPGLLNFSHFARPVSLLKANLQSSCRMRSGEGASTIPASTAPLESTLIEIPEDLKGVSGCQTTVVSNRGGNKSTPQPQPEDVCVSHSQATKWEDASRDNKIGTGKSRSPEHVSVKASLPGSRHVISKNSAPVVSSSVCSASGARNDAHKRKIQEEEEFGYQSEDLEDESAAAAKMSGAKGTTAKRSRAAEVHNLSERRRRDRINEKMRALQELIPNCNKADKASMLDEAIEYLKTLQLQVQIMSMGSGLCMPHMMLPPGMQHLRASHMAQFPPLGMGYGMGMLDMNGSPMIPMPPMHGLQFPCPVPGNPVMPGMAGGNGLQMFGIPGQGHPVATSCGVPRMHSSRVNTVPAGMRDASLKGAREMAPFAGLKDQQMQKLNAEAGHNRVEHHDTHIPTSSQATKEFRGDSSSAQITSNASQSSDGPLNSTSGNRNSSTGTSGSLDSSWCHTQSICN